MAQRASAVLHGGLDQVDSVKQYALGTRIEIGHDAFVYVQGVTSGAKGAVVTFTSAGVTTLIVANAIGRVGVMMSDLDATTDYGWVQVRGYNAYVKTDTVAAEKPCYIDGTSGRVDDLAVAGDKVYGMFTASADASNIASVFMAHDAYVTDESN
jgi:hypothetical protein